MSENDDGPAASNTKKRRPVEAGLRLAGTTALILVSIMVYLSGLWMIYFQLFAGVPHILKMVVIVSAALAPIQLMADIVTADRQDHADRMARNEGKK